MTTETKPSTKAPRVAIILVGVLALFQIIRVAAYTIVRDSLAGANAEAWLFPAMMDVLIGATALFVALGIWRGRNLLVWTAAIVFFCLSISDHMDAITVILTSKGPAPAMMSGTPAAVITPLAVMSALEAIAIGALTTKSMRDHYLAK